ncbi:MAG: hypothetical protein A4E49_03256 [Methanosaeta sp. PtaU1.Bin112]|nr:MAG: hypothetical protein A4E49_03256 [Methanosaeta sp. PtaU1.Bin112]
MFKLIKKIIKIKLFVIGLLVILWFLKKKHDRDRDDED